MWNFVGPSFETSQLFSHLCYFNIFQIFSPFYIIYPMKIYENLDFPWFPPILQAFSPPFAGFPRLPSPVSPVSPRRHNGEAEDLPGALRRRVGADQRDEAGRQDAEGHAWLGHGDRGSIYIYIISYIYIYYNIVYVYTDTYIHMYTYILDVKHFVMSSPDEALSWSMNYVLEMGRESQKPGRVSTHNQGAVVASGSAFPATFLIPEIWMKHR